MDFIAHDEWATRVLKANGEIYLTDWGEEVDYGPDFFPDVPEIEVFWVRPEGGLEPVGVLGESGIFDAPFGRDANGRLRFGVIEVADWSEIEVLPEWKSEDGGSNLRG